MDTEKLLQELVDSGLGDLIRERYLREILDEIRAEPTAWHSDDTEETKQADREWRREMADYLEENYL
jgi:hypothetical protein